MQARIATDLKELRNSSVFAFFMINALFVLIVFLLQLNKDAIHVKWPLGVKTNITYDETTQEVTIHGTPMIAMSTRAIDNDQLVSPKFIDLICIFSFSFFFFHSRAKIIHTIKHIHNSKMRSK